MICISLGSNIGHRLHYLWQAVELLKQRCLTEVRHSIVLETTAIVPFNAPPGNNFLNMVVVGETTLPPKDLLHCLKTIENDMGREQGAEKWSKRIIDIDILYYHDLCLNTPSLTLPHPELQNRKFFKHLLALMGVGNCASDLVADSFINSFVFTPRIVGVVNITKDSFSDGLKFYEANKAIQHINDLSLEGASVIEIGAQSTRPNAIIQDEEIEYAKLKEILETLNHFEIHLSIDTFRPSIVQRILNKYPISWINDVSGNFDDETLKMIAESKCQFSLMHSITVPPSQDQTIPLNENPVNFIMEWAKRSTEKLLRLGFEMGNIILDPGVGFSKTPYQSIEILRSISRLRSLGPKIMVGHSRKAYMIAFSKQTNPKERDLETIATSCALMNHVDFLRVHNVKDHMRAFVSYQTVINK